MQVASLTLGRAVKHSIGRGRPRHDHAVGTREYVYARLFACPTQYVRCVRRPGADDDAGARVDEVDDRPHSLDVAGGEPGRRDPTGLGMQLPAVRVLVVRRQGGYEATDCSKWI